MIDKIDNNDADKKEDKVKEVEPIITTHSITINEETLSYTATTGKMPLKNEKEEPSVMIQNNDLNIFTIKNILANNQIKNLITCHYLERNFQKSINKSMKICFL